MMLWLTIIAPFAFGAGIWCLGWWLDRHGRRLRALLGAVAASVVLLHLLLTLAAARYGATTDFSWGAGLGLSLQVEPMVAIGMVLIPLITLAVVLWAAATEEADGLPRLLGLLICFTGAMELLVLAADLLTVAVAWELLGFFSWILIAHRWREREKSLAANYAFNATRLGGLGLWLAAGAALAAGGSLRFEAVEAAAASGWGAWMAAGILVAAAAKSAQGPFGPWLFQAMEGPSSVSALLHSSTMVAAGAWLILRLHEPLAAVSWYGPAAMTLGLLTVVAGGITACRQMDIKKVAAASTSAHYGLMFIAAGAGYPAAGLVHLVAHAAFKALLFLAAGSAINSSGTHDLGVMSRMGLSRRIPVIAAACWVGTLALAAIPPLGAAWSKEMVIAAAGKVSPVFAVLTMAGASLSAFYALRFQELAFSRGKAEARQPVAFGERAGMWLLALISLLLGLLWAFGKSREVVGLLPGELAHGKTWELLLSIALAVAFALWAWFRYRRPFPVRETSAGEGLIADWWGLPLAIDRMMVGPTLILARLCGVFDRRMVDGGVRLAAATARWLSRAVVRFAERGFDRGITGMGAGMLRLGGSVRNRLENRVDALVDGFGGATGAAAQRSRSLQSGVLPCYLAYLVGGAVLLFLTFIFGAW